MAISLLTLSVNTRDDSLLPFGNTDPWLMALCLLVALCLGAAIIAWLRYRKLSDELQCHQLRHRAVCDTVTEGLIVFDEQDVIQELNPAAEGLFGWSAAELAGKDIRILLPAFQRGDEASSGVGKNRGREAIGRHKNGWQLSVNLILGRSGPLGSALSVAVVSDIAERKQFESALRESEEKFRSLVGNLPGISYRCLPDKNWTMLYISDAIEVYTGYPAQEFLRQGGITFSDIVHPDDRERIGLHILNSDKTFEVEYRIIHKDGRILRVWENGSLITNDVGEIVWLDGVILDITQRYEIEQVLRHEKLKAEHAVTVKTEFLANMSHEIRTPMNAITGFIEILLQTRLTSEQRQYLDTINNASTSLLHLLNDILDTAKLERGVVELEHVNFSLTDLVHQVVATLGVAVEQKSLSLRVEYASGLAEFFRGDEQRLRQVLLNLIGNAVKFTEQGEVVIRISAEERLIQFAIRDTGIGIAADRLEHIFEPFTQGDASMTRRFGGSGLGTTISKQLIELMGGSISVTSKLGEGSVFTFRIPLAAGELQTKPSTRQPIQLPPLHILAVDDVLPNLQLLEIVLRKGGHQVTSAVDGAEALTAFKSQRFDIILMDVQMPVMDGLEASRQIRLYEKMQQRSPTPIIALTASVLDADKLAARDAGMEGFASKPINVFELQAEIARLLGFCILNTLPHTPAIVNSPAPSISLTAGLALWQSETFYYSALRNFVAENRLFVSSLDDCFASQNFSGITQAIHRMRGAAVNLALLALADELKAISQSLTEKTTPDEWQVLRASLNTVMNQLFDAVSALPHVRDIVEPSLLIEPRESALALAQLKLALARGELDEKSLRVIKQAFRTDAQQILINKIHHAMLEFEFSDALHQVELLQQLLTD